MGNCLELFGVSQTVVWGYDLMMVACISEVIGAYKVQNCVKLSIFVRQNGQVGRSFAALGSSLPRHREGDCTRSRHVLHSLWPHSSSTLLLARWHRVHSASTSRCSSLSTSNPASSALRLRPLFCSLKSTTCLAKTSAAMSCEK